MSNMSQRIEPLLQVEPQYLQAATLQASQLNTLVWQKMALIFAVQSATLLAAFYLRGSLLSWITLFVGALFCVSIVFSIHSDFRDERGSSLKQIILGANYFACLQMTLYYR
jgi:hypothetical protein